MKIGQFKVDYALLDNPHVKKFLAEVTIKHTKNIESENCTLFVAEFDEFDDIDETVEDVPIYFISFAKCDDGTVRLPVERWTS